MPPDRVDDPSIQDPHRLALCAAAPETVWCQHHCGIFRSDDGGRNFVQIHNASPSAFGFAVAAHPDDPRTAWFVPAVKDARSEEHTSDIQSLMRISDAVFCLKKQHTITPPQHKIKLTL